jgi:hypothetical protein
VDERFHSTAEELDSPAGEDEPPTKRSIGSGASHGTIVSDGAEAAQAYIGPTVVPSNEYSAVQTQRVKVNLPQTDVTVRKGAAKGAVEAGAPGSIDAPMQRPAGAFQPIAVDASLVKEWMARKESGGPSDAGNGNAAAGISGTGRPADALPAADSVVDTGGSSPWAVTEKIDRSALPSASAPRFEASAPEPRGEPPAKKVSKSKRQGWVLLAMAAAIGIGGGLIVVGFVLSPSPAPSPVNSATSAVGTAGMGVSPPEKTAGVAPVIEGQNEVRAPEPAAEAQAGADNARATNTPPAGEAQPVAGGSSQVMGEAQPVAGGSPQAMGEAQPEKTGAPPAVMAPTPAPSPFKAQASIPPRAAPPPAREPPSKPRPAPASKPPAKDDTSSTVIF